MRTMMNGMFGGKRRDLRSWIVFVLSSGPRNGVEIMDSMEKQTLGMWRPSPGSIYPMLEKMIEEGTIRKKEDGKYELTDDGENYFSFRDGIFGRGTRTFQDALDEVTSLVTYMEELKQNGSKKYEENREKIKNLAERLSRLSGQ
ncbi:MAG: PadR family transcriptional regulator [Candidatus Thermoplasmatota archaeon]|jgi:DNA-binding PadR family transcriptional regulator|nr:PadR family transcriptional regulator [Candidatus Thermoplasmatota archaeon]MCL5791072.1 PadR family transcriptional regulator [Candidatus Thermoplasmatota archaeon]